MTNQEANPNVMLPIVGGFIYPCILPVTEGGEYLEVSKANHETLLELCNSHFILVTPAGEETEVKGADWQEILAQVSKHPGVLALQKAAAERDAAEVLDADTAGGLGKKIRTSLKRREEAQQVSKPVLKQSEAAPNDKR